MNEPVRLELEGLTCPTCFLAFAVPASYVDAKVAKGEYLLCPEGHLIAVKGAAAADRLNAALTKQVDELTQMKDRLIDVNCELVDENEQLRKAVIDGAVGQATAFPEEEQR